MSYGKIWCEKVRLIKKRIFGKGHQMTCVLQPQRERGGRDKERERGQTHFHTKTFEIQKKLGTMMPWMTLVANKGGQT